MSKILDANISSLRVLISGLLNYADTFSFVIRRDEVVSKKATVLIESLQPYLIETKEVSEWPGTTLLWERSILYSYYLNNETGYLLYTSEDNLFKWVLPHLPEDLVFYKKDNPLFVSITHEKDAYFEIEGNDEAYLKKKELI